MVKTIGKFGKRIYKVYIRPKGHSAGRWHDENIVVIADNKKSALSKLRKETGTTYGVYKFVQIDY